MSEAETTTPPVVTEVTETPATKKTEYKATALLNIKFNGKSYKAGEEFTAPKNKVDQLEGYATIIEVTK